MIGSAAPAARRALAAMLVIVLALTGAGRGLAAAPAAGPASVVIAGHVVQLCAMADQGDPAAPADHRDCDQCAVCAPIALPGAPLAWHPLQTGRVVRPDPAPAGAPHVALQRSPRQSQGPPAA